MLEHVRPLYAKKFRCIGSECGAICCHGWDVFVDKLTYGKYKASSSFRSLLNEHFVVLNNQSASSR